MKQVFKFLLVVLIMLQLYIILIVSSGWSPIEGYKYIASDLFN